MEAICMKNTFFDKKTDIDQKSPSFFLIHLLFSLSDIPNY